MQRQHRKGVNFIAKEASRGINEAQRGEGPCKRLQHMSQGVKLAQVGSSCDSPQPCLQNKQRNPSTIVFAAVSYPWLVACMAGVYAGQQHPVLCCSAFACTSMQAAHPVSVFCTRASPTCMQVTLC
jgi:hypothetical protein